MTRRNKLVVAAATGFGLGYSPIASGTVGSLWGFVLLVLMLPLEQLPGGIVWQCMVAAVLALVAIPVCGIAEKHFGKKDDGRIVADEYLTFPICMLGIPWMACPWMLLIGFLTARVFDIVKPPPARQSQSIGGGLGIVIDDVLACLYALGLNHLLYHWIWA
ncbi:MAG: phosphatidylglycerophosphatase A [Kiritimatiellae bacterium]|nr:phosphatidylglycerophosphatase A [Kiritimatiellia bacterium]